MFRQLLVTFACGSLLFACSSEEPAQPQASTEKPKVALIMKSLANEFFVQMAQGTRDHHSEHADQYDLIVNGTKDESDLSQQVSLVQQMIAARADAIVIAPADSKALIPVLRRAVDQGVVVINIDNKLDQEILAAENLAIPFVGPDNREGARKVGAHLAQTLAAGDEVAIIGGISTAFNAVQRQLGFEDAMREAGLEVVSVQPGDWEQAKASTVAAALITEHPGLKAILCSNDNMALGALAALRQAGKLGSIKVVGFDNISAVHEPIRSGAMLATADQYGHLLAVYGVESALQILNEGSSPEDRNTPVDLITAANLD